MPETNKIMLTETTAAVDIPLPGDGQRRQSLAVALRLQWGTMLVVAIVATVLSVAAIWMFVRPKYEVSATVHVAPFVRPILFKDYDTDISRRYQTFIATEARNIESSAVIVAALETAEVRALPSLSPSEDLAEEIRSRLTVEHIRGTYLLAVSMVGEDPTEMSVLVNSVVDVYLRRRDTRRRDWDEQILSSLRREESNLETKLKSRREQIRQLAVQGDTDGANETQTMLETWVAELQQLLTQARKDRALASAKYDAIEDEAVEDAVVGTDPVGFANFLTENSQLQTLTNELRTLELASLSDRRLGRGPGHPDVQDRPALIEALRARMAELQSELRILFADSVRRKLQADIFEAQITARFLDERLTEAREKLAGERTIDRGQQFVMDDLAYERSRFEQDLNRVKQKMWNIELERNRTARISLNSPARAPSNPNIDKRPKYTAAAVFLCLCLGAAAALMRHRLDTSFRDPEDVTERLGIRVLGSIQNLPDLSSMHEPEDPRVIEPIRGISTALLAASSEPATQVRLITSPTARSGKSTMAINLARSLASTGRRVLLVDADNNGQGVTNRLDLVDRVGLQELLAGTCAPQDVVYPTDPDQLHVLPAGQRSDAFGRILTRQRAQEKLLKLFQAYDAVIVDSAPVLAGSSTVILATLVHEVVLVLRARHSKTEEALAAQKHLAGVGARVVGVILNGVEGKAARYNYCYAYASEYPGSPA